MVGRWWGSSSSGPGALLLLLLPAHSTAQQHVLLWEMHQGVVRVVRAAHLRGPTWRRVWLTSERVFERFGLHTSAHQACIFQIPLLSLLLVSCRVGAGARSAASGCVCFVCVFGSRIAKQWPLVRQHYVGKVDMSGRWGAFCVCRAAHLREKDRERLVVRLGSSGGCMHAGGERGSREVAG